MIDHDTKEWLSERFPKSVRYEEPMAQHTSLGVGGPAEVYVSPETLEDLKDIVLFSNENHLHSMVIGGGSNLLVGDRGIEGLVISLARYLQDISTPDSVDGIAPLTVLAGTRLQALCRYAIDHGLEGTNFALGIPGTVGGGIKMNAGTERGQLGSVLDKVTVLFPSGEVREIGKEDLEFRYRSLSLADREQELGGGQPIILSGCFALHPADPEMLRRDAQAILRDRGEKQPLNWPSAGCFFKNPCSERAAGELIELAGLKGKRIGGAEVSAKHANFLINRGDASSGDFLALMKTIQDTVSTAFGVDLETEVTIVGT
jgi:UDP-N-acetylmuramate dehydrogenase